MPTRGNFRTKKQAENHAAKLRRNFPRMKPIRVKKADGGGYDVWCAH